MLALWDTTGTDVVRKLAEERRHAGGVASGLALTLIVVTDDRRVRAVEDAVTIAAESHPCRLLVVVRTGRVDAEAPSRLDAEIIVGGRLGPCEAVVLRLSGRLALHAESVVVPLLAPDVPTVTWWHTEPPERIAYDPLGVVAERRVTDANECPDPVAALHQRADDYAPGDTDLAWTRLTGWRTLVAGAFDSIEARPVSATITASPKDPSAVLMGGWLKSRLGVEIQQADSEHPELTSVALGLDNGTEVSLTREGGTAILRQTDQPDRVLPLILHRLGDELAEELRRLDADQTYGAALGASLGLPDLNSRPPNRVHIWRDPALAERPPDRVAPDRVAHA